MSASAILVMVSWVESGYGCSGGADLSTRLKILFVINDLYTRGNGLAASARRTIMLLRERGHVVRVLSAPPRHGDDCGVGAPDYPLPHLRIPLVAPLISSQGYAFARSDRLVRDGVIVHPVRFVFLGHEEMDRASRQTDLYVHAARIEVEGLGALEVLRHGVVPVLARGSLTATSQFALSAESVFEAGNPRSLARAIDAWIDRGAEARRSEAARYREVGQRYDICSCVGELERVYGWLVTRGEFPGCESDREEDM